MSSALMGGEQFVTQYSDMLGKTMEEVWISDDRTLMRFISRRWVWSSATSRSVARASRSST